MIGSLDQIHPIFVHFTVALLLTGSALYVLATLAPSGAKWKQTSLAVAHWNLWIGALVTVLTVSAGFLSYYTVAHDTPSHAAMTDHRNWAIATAAVFLLLVIWSFIRRNIEEPAPILAVLLVGASALLGITGLKGGELVYQYGLAVKSMPQSDSHDHAAGTSGTPHHDTAPKTSNGMAPSGDTATEGESMTDGHTSHDTKPHAH